jgi:abortive infection bacteriophage resistance protein
MVQYTSQALPVQSQVTLLVSKGMKADINELTNCLSNVSHHRLSGYWESFRVKANSQGDWSFKHGTNFVDVWDRYVFDRQLRLLILDAIERVEVAMRDGLILNLAVNQGAFGYLDEANLPNIRSIDNTGNVVYTHKDFLAQARSLCKREIANGNIAVGEFYENYSDAHGEYLPYWILTEIVDFGTLCRIFWGAPTAIKKSIARKYGLKSHEILESWMSTLRGARNRCAHHGKFWDGSYRVKPKLPNAKSVEWHTPVEIEAVKDHAFGTLTILKYLMGSIAPQSQWAMRLEALFERFPNIDRNLLGYPNNWNECPIWAGDRQRADGQGD